MDLIFALILANATYGGSDAAYVLVGVVLMSASYLIPTIVAWIRHHQIGPVAVINVFLGWTIIGWVVALAIAFGDRRPGRRVLGDVGPQTSRPH